VPAGHKELKNGISVKSLALYFAGIGYHCGYAFFKPEKAK
jgi:hypothetical protein